MKYLQLEMQSPFKGGHLYKILHFPCFDLSRVCISRVHIAVQQTIAQQIEAGEQFDGKNYRLQWLALCAPSKEHKPLKRKKPLQQLKAYNLDNLIAEAFSQPQHIFNSIIKTCGMLPWINNQSTNSFSFRKSIRFLIF